MKKIICIMLTLATVLAVAACAREEAPMEPVTV